MSEARDPDGHVTVDRAGHLLLVGLDRPEKYNGITPRMAGELADAYTALDEDPDLRVGVLYAHGPHFCAGIDLPKWVDRMTAGGDEERSGTRVDPFGLRRWCRKPIVAAVHGITFTAGIELMLAADVVVAAEDCRFSQLEPRRGIHATGGATFRFVERGGWGNAMLHLLTSDEFDAAEALRIGLVQLVVPRGEERTRAQAIAEQIAEMAPLAVQATKASARRFLEEGPAACVAALAPVQAELMRTADAAEGVASFVERREPRFTGR